MSTEDSNPDSNLDFPQTRWSLVVSASEEAGSALEELCSLYWRPVFHYLRRSGLSKPDAEDLTQSYFARLLKQDKFLNTGRIQGRLRYYLLGGVKRHLADYYRAKSTLKRGGGIADLPLALTEADIREADQFYVAQPADDRTPDQLFDQAWTVRLLDLVHEKVRARYLAADKELEYLTLRPALAGTSAIDSQAAASDLGITRDSVRVLASRLRKNFRDALREEISHTVTTREEIDDELRGLLENFA